MSNQTEGDLSYEPHRPSTAPFSVEDEVADESRRPGLGLFRLQGGTRSFPDQADRAVARLVRNVPPVAWALGFLTVDVATLGLGWALARSGAALVSPLAVLAFAVVTLLVMTAKGLYAVSLRSSTLDDLRVTISAAIFGGLVVLAAGAVWGVSQTESLQTVRFWLVLSASLAAGRLVMGSVQTRLRRDGLWLRPTLIVGAGRVGRLVAKRLLERPGLGLLPIGYLDKEPLEGDEDRLRVLGASWDLERVVEEHGVQQVIFSFSTAPDAVLLRMIKRCETLGLDVALVPRLFEKTPARVSVDHLGALPLLSLRPSLPNTWRFTVKHALDRMIAALLLLLFAPTMVAAAVAVYFSLGRPIFFRQHRIGRDGVEIEMLKFRTMRGTPADRGEFDEVWALRQLGADSGVRELATDERTGIGKLLRRTMVDELPQLFNVLFGQMSLVGPRPERTAYVRRFENAVYRYGDRHRVKSGITGWAQVNGLRGNTSLADRVEWDNYYIENWSLWLDVKVILLTGIAFLRSMRDP